MANQLDELIKEIAVKHGIAVSRDDPILVLQTINNRLMLDSNNAQQAQLDRHKEELEGLALRWGNDATVKAELILNAALNASKEVMDQRIQDGAKIAVAAMRDGINATLFSVMENTRRARLIGIFNIAASFITLVAAGIIFWVKIY